MTTDLKMAVFIDFDNIEIGVKNTLRSRFDVGAVLEALKERGEVVSKTAYGDWKRADDYSRSLTQHAIKMVQRNVTPGGDKNGADINLVVDALEMAFRHSHINAFVIVGGDSDFIALVEKLQQYDKKVFVVGGRAFTSAVLQRNCHQFIAYENLVPTTPQPARRRQRSSRTTSQSPVSLAIPLVLRAMKVLSEKDLAPQLGLLKSTLLQLDSTFSERNYGASTFRDFAEKLAAEGLVTLTGSGRTIRVELKDTARVPAPAVPAAPEAAEPSAPEPSAAEPSAAEPSVPEPSAPEPSAPEPSAPEPRTTKRRRSRSTKTPRKRPASAKATARKAARPEATAPGTADEQAVTSEEGSPVAAPTEAAPKARRSRRRRSTTPKT